MDDGFLTYEGHCRRALWRLMLGGEAPTSQSGPVPESARIVAAETLREFGALQGGNLNQHRALFGELRRRARMEWEVERVEDGDVDDPHAR